MGYFRRMLTAVFVGAIGFCAAIPSCAVPRNVVVDACVPAENTTLWTGEMPSTSKASLWIGYEAEGEVDLGRIRDTFNDELSYELGPDYEFNGDVTVSVGGRVRYTGPLRISSALIYRDGLQDSRTIEVTSDGGQQSAVFKLMSLRTAEPGDSIEVVARVDLGEGRGKLNSLTFQIRDR
jgi:hypothetical protein